jgi:hypothetical protein
LGIAGPPPVMSIVHNPRNFLSEIDRDFVATRYLRQSAGSSPPDPVLIDIDLEHILRPIRIVLQRRQTFNQPRTPLVNEKSGHNARLDIAEALQNFRPAAAALRIGTPKGDPEPSLCLLNTTASSPPFPSGFPSPPQDGCPKCGDRFADRGPAKRRRGE